jgi:hypothetical protein
MKMLTTILVTVALVSPAFAQKPAFQGTHPRPKPVIVAPASKPILLNTGKPITPDQKKQLTTAVLKASLPKSSSGNTQTRNLTQSSGTIVLTAEQTFMNGASMEADSPDQVNAYAGFLTFLPGNQHKLIIFVPATQNTIYTLAIKVRAYMGQNPQMTIVSQGSSAMNTETVNLSLGENEFAYAYATNSTGSSMVTLSSPNADWAFESCEITSTAF